MATKYAIRSNKLDWCDVNALSDKPVGMFINNYGHLSNTKSAIKLFDDIFALNQYLLEWENKYLYSGIQFWAVEVETKEVLKSVKKEICRLK